MRNRKIQALFSSFIAVVLVAAILFMVCIIMRNANVRIDCTGDKIYTLSDATKSVLGSLDKNVTVRFYYSKNMAQMPVGFKNYAKRVDDLLREYEINAKSRLKVERLNPKPDSDAEDSANLDGIVGQGSDSLGLDRNLYMGLAVRCGDQLSSIPFLNPEREELLEYDLTRAIISVQNPVKKKVGIMSSMKIMGGLENAQAMTQGQGGLMPAWYIISELKKQYNVVDVPLASQEIPKDIDILIVVHPKGISEATEYALDQFVLRGGRLLAFLDPLSITDLQMQIRQRNGQYVAPNSSSSLPKLLKQWNLEFTTNKVVLDRKCATGIQSAKGNDTKADILTLTEENLPEKDAATAQISSLVMLDAGVFSGTPADGLQKAVLLTTSDDAQLVEKYVTQRNGKDMLRDFEPDKIKHELIVRLTGSFKTAFPDGKPGEKKDDTATSLKEATAPGAVILVGDADMLYDAFCVSRVRVMDQVLYQPINHNISIVQNLMEQLSGDALLFEIRSRGVKQRPFVKVHELEQAASAKFQDEIRRFEEEVLNVQRELYDMQRTRKGNDKELLSREQKQAMQTIRKKEAEARKNLKQLRKDMRHDVESLETRLMLLNIALMPLLVILFGISYAFIIRRS